MTSDNNHSIDQHYDTAYRGQYHYSTKNDWINDPCGPIFYKGTYHLFYQHAHGLDPDTDHMNWGHATSKDLCHWEEKSDAISFDENGAIWTGSVVADENNVSGLFGADGGLVAFYTLQKNGVQQQSMAYSADDGETWTKYNGGLPLITTAMDPLAVRDFRDPKVFYLKEFSRFVMLVAGGPLRIFSSTDLLHWHYESGDPSITTECPDSFPLEDEAGKKVWILSLGGRAYMTGSYQLVDSKIHFVKDSDARKPFNFGPDCYATQHFQDAPDGKIYAISWLSNWAYASKCTGLMDTYNGMMSLVYEYSLVKTDGEYSLLQNPISQYDGLVLGGNSLKGTLSLPSGEAKTLDSYGSFRLSVSSEIKAGAEFAMSFQVSDANQLRITYDPGTSTLSVDRSKSTHYPSKQFLGVFQTVLPLGEDGKLSLECYVDRASLEIVVDRGKAVGSFLFFPGEDPNIVLYGGESGREVDYSFDKLSTIFTL